MIGGQTMADVALLLVQDRVDASKDIDPPDRTKLRLLALTCQRLGQRRVVEGAVEVLFI